MNTPTMQSGVVLQDRYLIEGTLGVGGMLIASAVHFSTGPGTSLHEVLVTMFLFMTAPVSAHLLCKAAIHLRVESVSEGYEVDAARDGD